MPWQTIMLLQNVFASIYALESRTLAKKYKKAHFQILAVTFAILYAVFLSYGILHIREFDLTIAIEFLPEMLLVASLFAVWTVLTFITLRYVDAAIGTLYSVLNILAVVVCASALIGEGLNMLQFLGAGMLVLSILLIINAHVSAQRALKLRLALGLSIVASIAFGLAITLEKHILDNVGVTTYAITGIGLQFLVLLVLALTYHRQEFRHFAKPKFRKKVAIMGLVRGGAGLLFILSLVGANNASLIGMLSGFKIILTTILAAILLKELKFIRRKLIAASIASVGVGLMLWP